jgi:hypothetical protein
MIYIQEQKVRENNHVRGKGWGMRVSRRPKISTSNNKTVAMIITIHYLCQFLPSVFLVNWFSPNAPV